MNPTSQKSQRVDELNHSIPAISKFSLIAKFPIWLTMILSACWRLIVQTTRGKCSFNLLPAFSKERVEKRNYQELVQTKQAKSGTGVNILVSVDIKHPFTVIASLGQLCANSGMMLIQRALGMSKFLLAVLLLGTVMLFHVQIAQAQPQVSVIGAKKFDGTNRSTLSAYSDPVTLSEGDESFEFIIAVDASINLTANINYEINQGGPNVSFLKSAGEALTGDVENLRLNNPHASLTEFTTGGKKYYVGDHELFNDAIDENDGTLTLTLLAGTGYTVDSANNSITITVTDNDGPIVNFPGVATHSTSPPSISSYRRNTTVSEHIPNNRIQALFYIPFNTPLNFSINYSVTESATGGDFLVGGTTRTVNLATHPSDRMLPRRTETFNYLQNRRNIYVDIFITGDTTPEAHGIITVTLLSATIQSGGHPYTIVSDVAQRSAVINVLDNDGTQPLLALVGAGGTESTTESDFNKNYSITEGNTGRTTVHFLMHIPTTATPNFIIKYRITQSGGNFLYGTTNSRVLNLSTAGAGVTVLDSTRNRRYIKANFEIVNDDVIEPNGVLTLTLESNPGYSIATATNDKSATINVTDNDAPQISVSQNNGVVSEATSSITYKLTATRNPAVNIMIEVDVTETGNMINMGGGTELMIPMTTAQTEVNRTITLTDDAIDEMDSVISIKVKAGTGYVPVTNAVANTSNTNLVTISVADNETPRVTISGVTDTSEDDDVTYTLATTLQPWQTIKINVSITQDPNVDGQLLYTGADASGNETREVTMMRSEYSAKEFVVDLLDRSGGTITLTVTTHSDGGYAPANSNFSITTTVNDPDAAPDGPIIELVSVSSTTITEGASNVSISFRVASSTTPPLANALVVDLTLSDSGDYLDTESPSYTTTVNIGTDGTGVYYLLTKDDSVDEENGTVTVTIREGRGYPPNKNYQISTTPARVSQNITVNDNDVPQVKISRTGGAVSESDLSFNYMLEANPVPFKGITINVGISQTGAIYSGASTDTVSMTTSGMATGTINLNNDNIDEAASTITIQVTSGSGYAPVSTSNANAATTNTITVIVSDDDVPLVSVNRASLTATEADGTISYSLSASPQPFIGLTINVSIRESGSMFAATPSATVAMTTSGSGTGTITLADDNNDEQNSTITIQVTTGTGYSPVGTPTQQSAPQHTIEIVVSDNDIPAISISGPPSKREDSNPMYTVTATPPPWQPISITINASQDPFNSSDLLYVGARTGTPQVQGTAVISVNMTTTGMANHTVTLRDEGGGSITLNLATGTGYKLADSNTSVTTSVIDIQTIPDGPIVELMPVSTTPIVEGTSAVFNFQVDTTSGPPVTTPLVVSLIVTQTGRFLDGTLPNSVNIPTSGSGSITIRTENDSNNEANGSFKVVIVQGRKTPANNINYRINTEEVEEGSDNPNVTQTIVVNDDDIPQVSVTSATTTTNEGGGPITYTLNANPRPYQEISIEMNITETGSVFLGTPIMTITMPTSGSAPGTITLHDDSTNEVNSTITIQVESGPGYAPVANPNQPSDPKNTITVIVSDDDLPQVSISLVSGAPTEGTSSLIYRLTATPEPYQDITVIVSVNETGDVISGTARDRIPMTTANSGTVDEPINIANDNENEADSTITIQVSAGTGYAPVGDPAQPSDPKHTITIVVADNDTPQITITSVASVNENDDARFTITATPEPYQDIKINVELTQDPFNAGNFLFVGVGTSGVNIGKQTREIMMDTTDNGEANFTVDFYNSANATMEFPNPGGGYLAAAIRTHPDGGYEPANTGSSHRLLVVDPDTPPDGPVIELVPVTTSSIEEGTDAVFNFQVGANSTVSIALEVNLNISQNGNFLGTYTSTVSIPTTGTAMKAIPTTDDTVDETDGSITVQILQGIRQLDNKNYRISGTDSKITQTIMVTDNDTPQVSITRIDETAIENELSFTYQLSATPAPYQQITVNVNISESGAILSETLDTTIDMSSSGSATGTINLHNDNLNEDVSTITIVVGTGNGYVPVSNSTANAPTTNTITVVVSDDDIPAISVSGSSSVSEDLDATFTLTADIVPWENITINVTISQNPITSTDLQNPITSADLLYMGAVASPGHQSLTVDMLTTDNPRGRKDFSLDLFDLAGGTITVMIATHPDGKYKLGNNPTILTHISDEDRIPDGPVIELSSVSATSIVEGNSVTFNFQAPTVVDGTVTLTQALQVNLSITLTGDFFSGTPTNDVDISTSGTGSIGIQTVSNDVNEADGSIRVTIIRGSANPDFKNYQLSTDPEKVSTTVRVTDDDIPQVSISENNGDVDEGDSRITYRLLATPLPYQKITINVNISETGNMISGTPDRQIDMTTADAGSVTEPINLANDSVNEDISTITITVDTGAGYSPVSDPVMPTDKKNSINIIVSDNDTPQVTITSHASVNENNDAVFTLNAKPVPWEDITINVTLSQEELVTAGQILYVGAGTTMPNIGKQVRQVMMTTADNGSKEFTVDLHNTANPPNPSGGYIKATVDNHSDKKYAPAASGSSYRTLVIDPDSHPTGPFIELMPVTTGSIEEGTNAVFNFQVAAGSTVTDELEINLSITQSGDFIDGTQTNTVTVSTSGTGRKTIPTDDDNNDEADGSITVEILQGFEQLDNKNYRISDTNSKVIQTIRVTDNDTPQVSITRIDETAIENDLSFNYQLLAAPAPYQEITVNVIISESGAILSGTQDQTIDITASSESATGTINFNNDNVDEDVSTITIVVDTGTGYSPVSNSTANEAMTNTITVVVSDDDVPAISISGSSSVSEDLDATFTLTANIVPWENITINVNISQSPITSDDILYVGADMTTGNETRTVMMLTSDSPRGRKELTINLNDVDGGSITVSIGAHADDKYKLGETSSILTHISDEDSTPTGPFVELASVDAASIIEGGTAVFNFRGVIPTGQTSLPSILEVNLSITLTGDFFNSIPRESISIPTSGIGSISIQTENDNRNEADGSIRVAIVRGSANPAIKNYQLSTDPDKVSKTVLVTDDDSPQISISENNGDVNEGDSRISYRLSATPFPYQAITINVSITESGDMIAGTPVKQIKMTLADSGIAIRMVSLRDDDEDEANSTISIQVTNGTGYVPVSDPVQTGDRKNTVEVLVKDNDVPDISITGEISVSENDDAIFTLSAHILPKETITINVSITQSPNTPGQLLFVGGSTSAATTRAVDMQVTDNRSKAFTIDLYNDNNETNSFPNPSGGTITVTVTASSDGKHNLAESGISHTVQIIDPDTPPNGPVVKILPVSSTPITEGTAAVFNFQAVIPSGQTELANALLVNISITQTGSFYTGSQTDTVAISTSGTGLKSLPTITNNIDEANGSITVTILSGVITVANDENYQLSDVNTEVSQTIVINDDDIPEVSISRTNGSVNEGNASVSYLLTADPVPFENITILLNIIESGSVIAASTTMRVTMTTSGMANGTINLEDDNNDEENSTVTVQVDNGTGYTPVSNSTANTASSNTISFVVVDNDVPAISIMGSNSVSEDNNASFTLMADINPKEDITININVSQSPNESDDILYVGADTETGNQSRTVMMLTSDTPLGRKSFIVELNDVGGGSITVSVNTHSDNKYKLGQPSSLTTHISDEDRPPDGPIVELVSVSADSIVEGTTAIFNFQAVIPSGMTSLASVLKVDLGITLTGNFFGSSSTDSVNILTNGSGQLSVPTIDDDLDEADGSIEVEIILGSIGLASKNYQISTDSTKVSKIVTVTDNDVPRVSISRLGGTVSEGDSNFTFTLSVSPLPYQDLTIMITVTESGDIIAGTKPDSVIMTVAQSGTTTGTINLDDDKVDEADSTITIQVTAGTGYEPVSTPVESTDPQNTIEIVVSDNDTPEISITGAVSVNEDSDATLTLSADILPKETISITINITQNPNVDGEVIYEGADQTGAETRTVMMLVSDNREKQFTIDLHNATNAPNPSGGFITVTVASSTNEEYKLATNGASHRILVIDSDTTTDGPIIELVTASSNSVEEGNRVPFSFQVDSTGPSVTTPLEVDLSVTLIGTFIIEGTAPETVNISTNGTVLITIPTVDDNSNEANGSITIEILQGRNVPGVENKNYQISTDPAKVSQTIRVVDNDIPQISISRSGSTVFEGDTDVIFTLTAIPAPYQEITVALNITESGAILAESQTEEIVISTSGTATGEIILTNNQIDELDSTVTIQVVEGTGYMPSSNNTPNESTSNTITFLVRNDDIPELTISANANVFKQNDPIANFTVISSVLPKSDLAVNYLPISSNIENSGISGTREVSTPPLKFVKSGNVFVSNLSIRLPQDSIIEQNAMINVTLLNEEGFSTNYTVGTPASDLINVYESSGYILSIRDGFTNEGESGTSELEFEVTLSPPAREPLNLIWSTKLAPGDNATPDEDFIQVIERPLEFATGESTTNIVISIIGDSVPEPNETFSIVIRESIVTGTINTNNANAKGYILNDDNIGSGINSIYIYANPSIITEGKPARFSFVSPQVLPTEGLTLNLNIIESGTGSYMAWRVPRTFKMTTNPATLEIQTINDVEQEDPGTITVSVIDVPDSYRGVIENETNVVTIISDDEPDKAPEARISVAQLAIDSILSALNVSQGASPSNLEAESAPAVVRPSVSITAVENSIDEGATARFLITSRNSTNSTNISVSFQVNQAHVQVELPGAMNVQLSGQDAVSIAIPTINNDHADEDGYIAVSLTEDPSYMIAVNEGNAVVNISDAIDRQQRQAEITAHAQAFLPDLTGRMGANNLGIVSNRITQGFNENANQVLELGGRNSVTGILTASGEAINENSTTLKSFLGDSSFAMSLISGDEFAIPTTLWGIGDYLDYSSIGSNKTIDWSGDLFTGHIGIDALINDGLLTGISASVSESEVEFDNSTTNEILFNVRTTSINPYLGWTSQNRNSELHATIGLGQGVIGVKQESYEDSTLDSESYSFGLNGNQVLFTSNNIANGTTKLSIKGDSWLAHQFIAGRDGILADFHTNAQHLRIRTEGSHQFDSAAGSTFSPLISIGIRNDVKDHQSVLGVELTSSADYNNPVGLTIAGTGSMLVGQANQVQKVTISSSLNYDRNTDNQGFIVDVSPTWGYIDANIQDTLWSSDILDSSFENGQYSNGVSLNSEFSYGFEFLQGDGLVTPISGFEISSNQDYEYLIGTRLGLGSNANFELSGIQSKNSSGPNSSTVRLEGRFNW